MKKIPQPLHKILKQRYLKEGIDRKGMRRSPDGGDGSGFRDQTPRGPRPPGGYSGFEHETGIPSQPQVGSGTPLDADLSVRITHDVPEKVQPSWFERMGKQYGPKLKPVTSAVQSKYVKTPVRFAKDFAWGFYPGMLAFDYAYPRLSDDTKLLSAYAGLIGGEIGGEALKHGFMQGARTAVRGGEVADVISDVIKGAGKGFNIGRKSLTKPLPYALATGAYYALPPLYNYMFPQEQQQPDDYEKMMGEFRQETKSGVPPIEGAIMDWLEGREKKKTDKKQTGLYKLQDLLGDVATGVAYAADPIGSYNELLAIAAEQDRASSASMTPEQKEAKRREAEENYYRSVKSGSI